MIDSESGMPEQDTATLSAKFQISIPKSVREARRWQAGQLFAFVTRGESVVLVPIPNLDDLAGLARGADPDNYRDRSNRV